MKNVHLQPSLQMLEINTENNNWRKQLLGFSFFHFFSFILPCKHQTFNCPPCTMESISNNKSSDTSKFNDSLHFQPVPLIFSIESCRDFGVLAILIFVNFRHSGIVRTHNDEFLFVSPVLHSLLFVMTHKKNSTNKGNQSTSTRCHDLRNFVPPLPHKCHQARRFCSHRVLK